MKARKRALPDEHGPGFRLPPVSGSFRRRPKTGGQTRRSSEKGLRVVSVPRPYSAAPLPAPANPPAPSRPGSPPAQNRSARLIRRMSRRPNSPFGSLFPVLPIMGANGQDCPEEKIFAEVHREPLFFLKKHVSRMFSRKTASFPRGRLKRCSRKHPPFSEEKGE